MSMQTTSPWWDRGVLIAMAVVLAVLPFAASGYVLYVVNLLMVFSVLALGMHLVIGETGQCALSHAAFFGIGIYTAGLINNQWQPPFVVSILAGALLAAALEGYDSVGIELSKSYYTAALERLEKQSKTA